MSDPRSSSVFIKRSVWLGLGVGWLVQLGLKAILPVLVLVGLRFLSLATESKSLWLEEPSNSAHSVWYALQASVILGSVFAGWLAAVLAPRKSIVVPAALVVLSLLATAFEQFPRPISTGVMLVWAVGPCVGLLVGWSLAQWLARRDA